MEQLNDFRDRARDFIARLIPGDLEAYIPGQKLIAGVVLYVIAEVFGVDAQVVELPVIGEVDTQELAAFVGFYLWPSEPASDDLEIERELALEGTGSDLAVDEKPDDADEKVPGRGKKFEL